MKKKLKEVVKTKSEDGKDLTLDVRHPTSRDYDDAKVLYSAEWTTLVNDKGVKTQKQINNMLEEKGIWTQKDKDIEKEMVDEIIKLGKQLKSGKTDTNRKMTKREGRELAIKIHKKRSAFGDHTAARNSYVIHSAEGMAEAKRFDYLVSVCTRNSTDGSPYFSSLDDYDNRKDEKASWDCASKLAEMIYGTDFSENFEDNVLEIQFLRKFGFVDEKGNYIDPKTKELVDVDWNPIKKEDVDTDVFGNKIKDGKVIVEFGEFADDEPEASPPPPLKSAAVAV